jgi:hypothetical protein
MTDHGQCPACDADLNGGSIWQTMLEQSNGDEAEADRKAETYGADRTTGQWGREINVYDRRADRVTGHMCPDCNHVWKRGD